MFYFQKFVNANFSNLKNALKNQGNPLKSGLVALIPDALSKLVGVLMSMGPTFGVEIWIIWNFFKFREISDDPDFNSKIGSIWISIGQAVSAAAPGAGSAAAAAAGAAAPGASAAAAGATAAGAGAAAAASAVGAGAARRSNCRWLGCVAASTSRPPLARPPMPWYDPARYALLPLALLPSTWPAVVRGRLLP